MPLKIKPSLTHHKQGKDYLITLKLPSKVKITHSQNRIKKSLIIHIPELSLKEENIDIFIGLIKKLITQSQSKGSTITITLKRPLRYQIDWIDNHTLAITLKNIMRISSLLPVNQDVIDFHFKTFNIDLHNDLLFQLFMKNLKLNKEYPFTESDLPKVIRGGAQALFFSVWVPDYFLKNPGKLHIYKVYFSKFNQYKDKPFKMTLDLINKLLNELKDISTMRLALTSNDLLNNWKSKTRSALMGLEGSHTLEGQIDRLKILYDKGIRYIGITWSNSNQFADAAGESINGGLSSLGEVLIKEMMKLGMLIDVSHCSDQTFYDILKITQHQYPVIATHSAARTVLNHKRNLSDEMIRAITKSGGVIGVVYHSGFLTKKKKASIEDLFNHIDYLVEIASIDHVALGSDYDGFITPPVNLENMSKLPNLTLGLYNRGYSFQDIEKILGQNFLRVFKRVEQLKKKK